MNLRGILKACSAGLVAVVIWSPSPVWAAGKLALIIGNGAYQNATTLPNPPNDASDMEGVLKGMGFDIVAVRDGNKLAMDQAIRTFAEKAETAEVTLFFYAGHGMQVNGVNYLIPVDAKLETSTALDFETINAENVIRYMSSDERVGMVFLDACRDNPLSRRFKAKSRSAAVGSGLAVRTGTDPNLLIAFATSPGEVALDGNGRNSPFTTALIKHLPAAGKTLNDILIDVKADVQLTTGKAQIPWTHDNLTTKVYLAGKPAADDSGGTVIDNDKTKVGGGGAALPDPALTAWEAVKDQTNPAIFDELARSYPGTYYANAALLRAAELRESQVKEREAEERRLALLMEEEQRKAEEKRRAEAERKAEEKRRAEEEKRKKDVVDPEPAPPPARLSWGVIIGTHTSLAAAKGRQRDARVNGLKAAVINTDDYPGLTPGYWAVVVSASSREDAKAKAVRIRSIYADANARKLQ